MNYTVTLDGTESPTLNSSTYWFVPETTLFYQGGLDASKVHTLNLTQTSFEATDDPLKLGFDYVAVYGYQDPSSNSSSTNPNSDNSTSSHKSPVGGVVAGAVVGALALGLAIFVFVWWRRRRTRTRPNRIELLTEVGTTKMDMGNIGLGCGASPSATPLISADTGAGRREGGKFSHVHGSSLSASSSGGYDSARSVPRSATETPSLGYVAAMSDLGSDAGSGVPEGTAIASSGVLSRFNSTGEHASWRGQGLAGVSEETRSLGNNEKSPRVLSPSLRSLASSAALGSPITPGPGQNAAHGQGGAGAGTCGRPLPPPPGTTPSSPPVQIHSMYMHPPQQHSRDVVRSLVQEHVQHGQVQQPGGTGNNEEVDRILEMIAARIDQPEDHSMPPPEYPRR
ncbi:hypothetical protein CONPUDRAFT_80941 [Coniophora puteana RWD-64-598 SS2]|uniref:Uncharacterized protein n=1 Tax=Coniophora puteana (strain RWD-64-598) TaxID=741705 RepID=A0A5M3MU57_CONPW|nr:uncharacterized protein CONPUDRAFT_80941 [Coniophora puteana RWD-64-598 SS2]EIW82698.1 hypothetical protein CONPUDRAFT_80941 [Coniophora puteana RWD-64-598 SS2]